MSNISSKFKSNPSSSSSGSDENSCVRGTPRVNAGDGAKALAVDAKSATRDRTETSFMVRIGSVMKGEGFTGGSQMALFATFLKVEVVRWRNVMVVGDFSFVWGSASVNFLLAFTRGSLIQIHST